VDTVLHVYGNLITKDRLEEDDKIEDYINPDIHKKIDALGDPNLRLLEKGQRIQLERTGFFIVDSPWSSNSPLQLVMIPDGKTSDIYKRG